MFDQPGFNHLFLNSMNNHPNGIGLLIDRLVGSRQLVCRKCRNSGIIGSMPNRHVFKIRTGDVCLKVSVRRRFSRSVFALCAGAAVSTTAIAVSSASENAARAEPPSIVTLRRLSQDQYRQSIADIFGRDIRISGRLEPDPRRDGLIALGVANAAVGAAGFEQFDLAAREIAAQVTDPLHRSALVGCQPRDPAAADQDCARTFVTRVGRLLYRRPLEAAERERLVAIASQTAEVKRDFYSGISRSVATMLISPSFLFRTERAVHDGHHYRLDDYSVASRLSFMIWNAPPDEALLGAAARGDLRTRAGLGAQVDRMMASPRFEGGIRAFFTDMLALPSLDGLQKDPAIYPRFTSRLAADAREQTLRTIVDALVRRNEDYRSLFTTRRTFMSRSLGLLYSQPVTSISGWEPYEFAEGDPRAGLLAQPSFVMSHSHPGRSSPTLRGKAVRELLLCQQVPAPPANVDFAVVQNVADPRFATARKRLIAHNTEPMCAACHQLMDPLGLPLEGFDGAGGLRTEENGTPLDLTGEHMGRPFTGSVGLGQAIAADPALTSCLIDRLYSYGAGRVVNEQSDWLEPIRRQYEMSDLKIRDLVRAIALSDEFYRIDAAAKGNQTVAHGATSVSTKESGHGS
jgi:hypothetical protein